MRPSVLPYAYDNAIARVFFSSQSGVVIFQYAGMMPA
jgi:hypothetical protein